MTDRVRPLRSVSAALLTSLLLACGASDRPRLGAASLAPAPAPGPAYEVWLTDQNNTAGFSPSLPRGTHGGRLLIYQGRDLDAPGGPLNRPTVLDLAALFALGGAHNTSGVNVVRPHMALPSPDGRFMALAFVASGHVAIFDGATRQPLALLRMSPGAGGARQAHSAFWTPDGRSLIVANQNGKLLERIDHDELSGTFTHVVGATLDLAGCTTPGGRPCQTATPLSDLDPAYLGEHHRPDNAPICPVISSSGMAFVTLRGGGLMVVDPRPTPMKVVAAFGNTLFGRDGCGGQVDKKNVYLNSGTGSLLTNPHEFTLYHMRDEFPRWPRTRPDNDPELSPRVFFRSEEGERDAHGMILTSGRVRHLWQFDRLANVAEVFRLPSRQHVGTVDLTAGGVSADPTPDLVDLSPRGDRIYAALRGPAPQTGAHASAGSTPGLGIVSLSGSSSGALTHVLRTTFTNPVTGAEESDPHAASVRLISGPPTPGD